MTFNCLTPTVVFQEVPGEISLCFSITGCKVGCKGCHSTELWNQNSGIPLSNKDFCQWLNKYQNLISCVLFFGGEWQPQALIDKLRIARQRNLKTCLYTGEQQVDLRIMAQLDFLKTGKWQAALGGLTSPTTNQQFFHVPSNQNLNHLFQQGELNAAA